jgi:hypothetical protein
MNRLREWTKTDRFVLVCLALAMLLVALCFGGCYSREQAIGLRNIEQASQAQRLIVRDTGQAVGERANEVASAASDAERHLDAGDASAAKAALAAVTPSVIAIKERLRDLAHTTMLVQTGIQAQLWPVIARMDPKGETRPNVPTEAWLEDAAAANTASNSQATRQEEENEARSQLFGLPWEAVILTLNTLGLGGVAEWARRRRKQAQELLAQTGQLRAGLGAAVSFGKKAAALATKAGFGEQVESVKDDAAELQEFLGIRELIRHELKRGG